MALPWEAWVTLAVVGLVLWTLGRNVAAPDVVLVGAMAVLTMLSALSDGRLPRPAEMARGFGNEGLLTVGVLFVVARGLTETGGLAPITERLLGRPRSVATAQLRLMLLVAPISAFLNNTPVVAMFMPVVSDWCKRTGLTPSKLFIPLSYAAILGGVCTLIGTSTNLVVHGLMLEAHRQDHNSPVMGMFTIGAVGVPVAIVGIAFVILAARWLLPERRPAIAAVENPREYTVEMMVVANGEIDGRTVDEAGLRHLAGVYLMEVERDGESLVAVGPEQRLHGHDRLIFVGRIDSVVDLQRMRGLVPATGQLFKLTEPRPNRRLVEAVVSYTCSLVGQSIREGRFRSRYDAAIIAVHRNGERILQKVGDIVLQPGDTLLLEAHPSFAERHRDNRDFFLVSAIRDSQPRRHERAWIALAILGAMVVAMGFEHTLGVSVFTIALAAAGLMLVTRCCSAQQARGSIDWSTLVAIGASFGIGRAIETSGAAAAIAAAIGTAVGTLGPWGLLAGVYLMTLIFTELVTNNAAAVLAFPIARAMASAAGLSLMPFALVVAIAASAGFATPLGYQTHLMVYGPGGYRFADYVRIGLPLDLVVMTVAVALTPIFFPFHG